MVAIDLLLRAKQNKLDQTRPDYCRVHATIYEQTDRQIEIKVNSQLNSSNGPVK